MRIRQPHRLKRPPDLPGRTARTVVDLPVVILIRITLINHQLHLDHRDTVIAMK
jgi:hypothetical protein